MALHDTSVDDGWQLPSSQKAAQFHPHNKSVHVNNIPIPSIEPDEILVKVRAASLCHTDLMLFEPNELGLNLGEDKPFTMGHEACGIIIQVGDQVQGFVRGDRIGWLPIIGCCFDCEACQFSNLYCEKGTSIIQGMTVNGFFQEYCAVHWRNAAHVPEGMDLDNLAPMFCAGSTSFNAVTDTVNELIGGLDWVAVIGCGGLSHLGIQYLKAYGKKVIGVDISNDALEEAKAEGVDHVFNPADDKDYVSKIIELAGIGCYAAINFTDSVASYSSTVALLRMNGILMVTGIPLKPLQIQAVDISMNRIRVRGSNAGITSRLKQCLDFSRKYGIKPHVTQCKLHQVPEMIELLRSGKHKGRLGVLFQ